MFTNLLLMLLKKCFPEIIDISQLPMVFSGSRFIKQPPGIGIFNLTVLSPDPVPRGIVCSFKFPYRTIQRNLNDHQLIVRYKFPDEMEGDVKVEVKCSVQKSERRFSTVVEFQLEVGDVEVMAPKIVKVGDDVKIVVKCTSGTNVFYHVDLGDGNIKENYFPQYECNGNDELVWHIYNEGGITYNITTYIENNVSKSTTLVTQVEVQNPVKDLYIDWTGGEVIAINERVQFSLMYTGPKDETPSRVKTEVIILHMEKVTSKNRKFPEVTNLDKLSWNQTFKEVGTYKIIAYCNNHVSNIKVETIVEVEEPVTALDVNIEGMPLDPSEMAVLETNKSYIIECKAMTGTRVAVQFSILRGKSIVERHSGNVATLRARHSFEEAGIYNLSVMGYNNVSSLNTTIEINVQERVSELHIMLTNSTFAKNVEFEVPLKVMAGSNLQWTINFGDGDKDESETTTEETQVIFKKTYRKEGKYQICAAAFNLINKVENCTEIIEVETPLDGFDVMVSPSIAEIDEPVEFFLSKSNKRAASVIMILDFQDGTVYESAHVFRENISITHQFSKADVYNVTVTVKNAISKVQKSVNVSVFEKVKLMSNTIELRTTLDYKITKKGGIYYIPVGIKTHFTLDFVSGTHVTAIWNFPDGEERVSFQENKQDIFTQYTFNTEGYQNVTLTLKNPVSPDYVEVFQCQIQKPVLFDRLDIPDEIFGYQNYSFLAKLKNIPSSACWFWDPGDSSEPQIYSSPGCDVKKIHKTKGTVNEIQSNTDSLEVTHVFTSIGNFRILFYIYNEVSSVRVEGLVNIELICEPPSVHLVYKTTVNKNNVAFYDERECFRIEADAKIIECPIASRLVYHWGVTPLYAGLNADGVTTADLTYIQIEGGTLKPGGYQLDLEVTYFPQIEVSSQTNMTFNMTPAEILIEIFGGRKIELLAGTSLKLEAILLEGIPDSEEPVTFMWYCHAQAFHSSLVPINISYFQSGIDSKEHKSDIAQLCFGLDNLTLTFVSETELIIPPEMFVRKENVEFQVIATQGRVQGRASQMILLSDNVQLTVNIRYNDL